MKSEGLLCKPQFLSMHRPVRANDVARNSNEPIEMVACVSRARSNECTETNKIFTINIVHKKMNNNECVQTTHSSPHNSLLDEAGWSTFACSHIREKREQKKATRE